jgi:hypothetical protein
MSGATEAAAYADSAVEQVREDPMGRLGLLRQMYRVPTPIDRGYLPYRRAASAFMRWQLRRGLLNPPTHSLPGSPWWRAVNEGLLRDTAEARALGAALVQGKAITVSVNSNSLYSSVSGWKPSSANPDFTTSNHAIQVLKVDTANGKVWVNDSAGNKGGEEYSLSGFMKAWQTSDYSMNIVSAIPQSNSEVDTIAA